MREWRGEVGEAVEGVVDADEEEETEGVGETRWGAVREEEDMVGGSGREYRTVGVSWYGGGWG